MVGHKIKEYIEDNGIKQSFLSEKSGLSKTVICTILNETRKVEATEYYSICKALSVPLNYFFDNWTPNRNDKKAG